MDKLLIRLLEDVERISGKRPDCVVVGTPDRASQVLDILKSIGRDGDVSVVMDDESSFNCLLVCNFDDLQLMPGGGRN